MARDIIELRIDSLSHGGDGVARDPEGRVVFVHGGAPGDLVRASIVKEEANLARADITEIIEPSPDRVPPRCPYADVCGGCQWQHVAYGAQARAKRRILSDALERVGGFSGVPIAETVTGTHDYGYRNRIELTVEHGDRLAIGYRGVDGTSLVPVDSCDLLPDAYRSVPKALSGALRYLAGSSDLNLTRVGFRTSRSGGTSEIDLWTAPGPFPRAHAAKMLADALRVDTVARVLTRPEKGPRAVRGVEVLRGRGYWVEHLAGFEFTVSAASFFQVNTALAERLVSLVLDALSPSHGDVVLDGYCGVGTFTLPLASAGADVIAVESSGSAVRDLRRNLEHAGLDATVLPGDAARAIAEAGPVDLAVVDPPRSGVCRDTLRALVDSQPRRIVYVSCDPATLARDGAALADAGWRLVSATPVDLFPQTYHVEAVAVFDRV